MTRARDLAAFVSNADGDIKFDTDTLFIDSSANRVGIGTTAPSADLTVGDGATGTKTIALGGAGSSSSVMNLDFLGGGTGNPSGRIGYASSTEAMTFHTGDLASIAERMRIDNSGDVGIGTSSPVGITNYTGLTINNATNGGFIDLQNNGTTAFRFLTNGSVNNVETRTATPIVFLTNTTERMRILPTGGLTFNGDTAAANALDDYEEGTWTPTDNSTAGLSLTTRTPVYTKIGRLIYFYAYISIPATANTSAVAIDGLPYTIHGNEYFPQFTVRVTSGSVAAKNLTFQGSTSGTVITLFEGDQSVTNNRMSGQSFLVNGVYETT